MPERLAASSGGDVPGFMMVGKKPERGRVYAVSNNDAIGWGATAFHDGINATNHISGSLVRNTPIEVLEMKTGMSIEKSEFAGRQRRWREVARRCGLDEADPIRARGRVSFRHEKNQNSSVGTQGRP